MLELIKKPIDFVLHIDKYLDLIIANFGVFTYIILFIIIFCETGLVITPILPGDSLLFIAGVFSSRGLLNVFVVFIVFCAAAILGDSLNYWIGDFFGEKVFSKSRFFKKEHLDKTKEFYEKHGGKTIILARFIPIIRTFAPFVAGVGKMNYARFLMFNIVGGVAWVSIFLFAGYYFGKISWIQENLTLIIILIVVVSFLPVIFEYIKSRRIKKISCNNLM